MNPQSYLVHSSEDTLKIGLRVEHTREFQSAPRLLSSMKPGHTRGYAIPIVPWRVVLLFVIVFWWYASPCTYMDVSPDRGLGINVGRTAMAQAIEIISRNRGRDRSSCDGRQHPRPAAIYSAVGHIDRGVGLELKADINIPGACEVNLPIQV